MAKELKVPAQANSWEDLINPKKQEEKKFEGSSELDTKEDDNKGNEQGNEQQPTQENEQIIAQSSGKDNDKDNKQDSGEGSNKGNEQSSVQHTNNVTNKYTIEKPAISELVNERLVANVTRTQKKYVKEMAKKFENESAFVRYMIDHFMKNVEIK